MDVPNIQNNDRVIKGKLVAYREDVGDYTTYVFEMINFPDEFNRYIMCTKFPNWDVPPIKIGDVGYLRYRCVIAGKDVWFNGSEYIPYKCTNIHFLNFIPEAEKADLIC